jgi:hypothetical protein
MVPWAESYWLVRFVFQRGLALIYLVAFLVAATQFRPLAGEDGLLPLEEYVERASFAERPSLFYYVPDDRVVGLAAWTGVALALLALFAGPYWLPDAYAIPASMLLWAAMWGLYQSFVNAGFLGTSKLEGLLDDTNWMLDRFTDREIRDQVMTLLFAGHDTTTSTVTWALMLLGQHRAPYRRLQEEITATLGYTDADADDLDGGLPLLENVVAETLRLYPPAWIGPRRAIDDFEIYGHRIPGGTNIAYSSWLTHRLPHVFPDPDAFDPDRWTGDTARELQPGAYVPFGRGPRTCIGMRFGELEVKTILTTLLRRHHLELLPGQDFRAHTQPTISPRNGVRMIVRPRDHAGRRIAAFREPAGARPAVGQATRCPPRGA